MPDFALSDRGRAVKRVVAEEPKQRELIEQINAGQTQKFSEFMDKEREALQALKVNLQHDETTAQRFIDMANMFKDNELKREYFKEMLNVADTIRHHTNTTYPMFEKAYKDLLKEMFPTKPKDIHFTDKKGKEHILTKEVQQQWLDTFNLKGLDDTFIPNIPQEVREAIGKEIRLTKGSLYKIIEKSREKYIPQIKETLEKPQIVIQDESEFIFAKQIKDDLYLTSIGKDFDTHITIISNSPKTDKTIQNKLKNGKVIYEAKNAEALPTTGAFTETNQVPFSNDIIPQNTIQKDNGITPHTKDTHANTKQDTDSIQTESKDIESKSTQEPVTQKETQENTQAINQSEGIREQNQHLHLENLDTTRFFETINNMQGKNLSKKDKIQLFDSFTSALQSRQDLIIDEIERILKHANKSGDRKYKDFSDLDKYAMKEIFFKLKNKDLYDDYESILKALKANKDIDWDKSIFKEFQNTEKGIALSNNKISSGVAEDFAKSLKEWELDNNHIVNKFKDTIQSQKIKDTHANTKQHSNTTNHTDKETSTKESHTDNKHEATQRENGANTEWITTRTSNNPQENKDTETTLKRDNGIGDEYSPSTKEMAQEWNEKTHEKRDIRDDSSHSSSDTETNANISRDTQGHNAGIRLDETDNKRYKHDGNDDRTNSRTRIHRNVSLKKKGKKDSNANIESKVATQDIDTQSTPQVKPKKLTDKEVIDNFLKEYDNGSKELAALKEVKNPGIMQDLAKYIKQFDESKRLQDNIRKLDSNNELTQIDFVEWYKGALKEVAKGSEDSFVYSVNGYLKKLREENNYLDWKAAQEIQTTPKDTQEKDVSLNAQHDKEIPKTTREIIDEAKASGKSAKETKKLVQKNKELSKKVTSKLSKDELDNLPIATQDELRGFLESVEKKEYQNAPDVLKIATLNDELKSLLNHNNNANVFITKSTAGHISQNRKGQYNQALRMEEKLEIPQVINEAQSAYIGGGDGFVIPFADKINKDKINLIVLNSDEKGNFLITTKKVNTNDFNEGVYKEARAGVEPATTTLHSVEQKPTEAISLAKPNPTTKAEKSQNQSPKELENIESDSNPAGLLNPEELATLNKEFKLGEIQDLKGQKALYDANIESLSLLDDILKSGRIASDDEKRILSNFRGFGKASNELYQVIKEKGERLDSLNKLLESLSESVGAKIDTDYLFRRAGDAYYTPTPIVEAMVKLAKDLGLNNNHVILEPSSGSGRFLGQFHSNANVVGIELDPFTAKLSQTIYPYFKIDNAGFQNSKFAKDDFYDLVIGNPPYSNFTIRDDNFSASAHNYFMKRGIDKLRVGGISIQIVTKSFTKLFSNIIAH